MIELPTDVDKLLEELKEQGINLSLNGKKLRVEGKLSDDLKDRICEHKDGLIQLVEMDEHRWRKVDDLAIPDKALDETQADETSAPSWQDFYPDLAPADFEITEMTEGIGGRKIRGAMVGTVGFFIPRGKLEQGPPTKRKGRTREEWDFSRLHIPSQTDPGNVDVWMVARRLDSQGWKFWFLKRGHP